MTAAVLPPGAGCAHRVHSGGVRDARAHRLGEGEGRQGPAPPHPTPGFQPSPHPAVWASLCPLTVFAFDEDVASTSVVPKLPQCLQEEEEGKESDSDSEGPIQYRDEEDEDESHHSKKGRERERRLSYRYSYVWS